MIWSLRHLVIWSLIGIWSLGFGVLRVAAIYDPLIVPNNRVGVHVLDPDEVEQAAKLVNSNGGDWGYITVVLRSNELDRDKWTKFFEASRRLRVIPIVRLATYPDGGTWVKPDALDLVDFANFLADMPWPTENRYLILFNEVNHAAEWGGRVDPLEYATLLLDARRIFKQRSADFFLLSAGLDMSAPQNNSSWDALSFYRQMTKLQPDWIDAMDGLSFHAYPNPGFSSSVFSGTRYGIQSYRHELKFLNSPLPLFITETGWPHDQPFFRTAFEQVWTEPQIVAITPFVLFAGSGDFAKFSLLSNSLAPKSTYQEIFDLPKVAGSPQLAEPSISPPGSPFGHPGGDSGKLPIQLWERIISIWTRLLGLNRISVSQSTFTVEIADIDTKRSQGLSGRSTLGKDRGMLFVFDRPAQPSFWMKDMNFALDFIWVRGGKVVEITPNVPPPSQTGGEPQTIIPQEKIDQVLEVNAGTVDKYGIKVGDIVRPR